MSSLREHVKLVGERLSIIAMMLVDRAAYHDMSKAEDPEKLGWELMDKEPKYPYGTSEYFDKMRRYQYVFDHHYEVNRHHPEHYANGVYGMDLLDLIEMLCDWFSYKKEFTIEEGHILIEKQCARYNIDKGLKKILLNSFDRYIIEEKPVSLDYDFIAKQYADAKLYAALQKLGVEKPNKFEVFEDEVFRNQQEIIKKYTEIKKQKIIDNLLQW